jgi:L-alanine-DL-glutamate epimerase-like enolase superfamily enzyme
MPLPRPMQSGSSSGKKGGPVSHINMPIVFITTEDGTRGLGYAWSLLGGATASRCILRDDFAPLLIDEDALDHERLWHTLYRRLQSVGRHGLVTQAQAAVDLALWDIKGKIAGLPVYKLLGGCRESAPVYGSDGGWLYMSVAETETGVGAGDSRGDYPAVPRRVTDGTLSQKKYGIRAEKRLTPLGPRVRKGSFDAVGLSHRLIEGTGM